MAKAQQIRDNITFKYIFQYDYVPQYANGVYGGVTAQGEIVSNFYLERHALPNSQSHAITPQRTLGDVVKTDPEDLSDSMVRQVSSGVVFSLRAAKEYHTWLGQQIAIAEKVSVNDKEKK